MPKKKKEGSLTFEQLKLLCDFNGTEYISKKGSDYIDALSSLFPLKNNNDTPFQVKDVLAQPTLEEFSFPGKTEFSLVCTLQAAPMRLSLDGERTNEQILASNFTSPDAKRVFKKALGVAYMITCPIDGKEYIVKFGQSRTTFEKRLGSYNCGIAFNWRTASTTNIKILQSLVATRLPFHLYLKDCSQKPFIYTWHEVTSVPFASPESLAVEDIMLGEFKRQFKKRPLANVQAKATKIR